MHKFFIIISFLLSGLSFAQNRAVTSVESAVFCPYFDEEFDLDSNESVRNIEQRATRLVQTSLIQLDQAIPAPGRFSWAGLPPRTGQVVNQIMDSWNRSSLKRRRDHLEQMAMTCFLRINRMRHQTADQVEDAITRNIIHTHTLAALRATARDAHQIHSDLIWMTSALEATLGALGRINRDWTTVMLSIPTNPEWSPTREFFRLWEPSVARASRRHFIEELLANVRDCRVHAGRAERELSSHRLLTSRIDISRDVASYTIVPMTEARPYFEMAHAAFSEISSYFAEQRQIIQRYEESGQ